MIHEVHDKSGAILFKRDPDSLRYEELLESLRDCQSRIEILEKSVDKLLNELHK